MFGINYDGLRKKKTYDELIDYVMNKQEKIQYPDRTAKKLRNSPQLSNLLDGDGERLMEMEEQQKHAKKRNHFFPKSFFDLNTILKQILN